MTHPEFRKRIEALALELNKLHDEMTVSPLEADKSLADFILEVGQFEAARLILEDIACHEPPAAEPEPKRIVVPG